MKPKVKVVATGTANLASVLAGLARAGAEAELAAGAESVRSAGWVVLPGVGAFAAAMEALRRDGLVEPLAERIRAGRPTLAVCLGLQLFCGESEEDPGVKGLGVLSAPVRRFPTTVRVPQMGWNRIEPQAGCSLLTPGYAYFANSYRLTEAPEGWSAAMSDHAGPFVAAVEKGAVLGCQFHPELSDAWGLDLLRRWLSC
ncbi:MAG: imidazole glycerol phosphate synthase subunit HisH [Planctomycetota bacterium]